jgi:hypothetical protein
MKSHFCRAIVLLFVLSPLLVLEAADTSDGVERELAVKLNKAGQWALAVHGGLYDRQIRPFLALTVQQLQSDRGENLLDAKTFAANRSGLVPAGILLASVIKNLTEKSPILKESIELAHSESASLNAFVIDEFFWLLLKAIYEDSRFQIKSHQDLEALTQNLSAMSSLLARVPGAEDIFVSLYMKGLAAAERLSPVFKGRSSLSVERHFIARAGVHPAFAEKVRLAIIKHFGERMDRVDYSPERSRDSDDAQREAVVQEIFDLAELSFVPHQAESFVSTQHRRTVLSYMIRALQNSETELSFADINEAELRVFPEDRIPEAQKFWERQMQFLLLQSNMEIAERLKDDFNQFSVGVYDRLKATASEGILVRAQIPTVRGGLDLFAQIVPALQAIDDARDSEDLTSEEIKIYGQYLLRLWIERSQDLLKDRVHYDADELLMVPHALNDLFQKFPELKSEKAQIKTIRSIIERLMKVAVYITFDRAESAEDIIAGLWRLNPSVIDETGFFTTKDCKRIQRELMKELMPIFSNLNPSEKDWSDFAMIWALEESYSERGLEEGLESAQYGRIKALIASERSQSKTLPQQAKSLLRTQWHRVGLQSQRLRHLLRPVSTYQQLVWDCRARLVGLKK